MARHLATLGTLTIASGQTTSNAITTKLGFGYATDIVIYGPAAATGTLGVEVSVDGSTWRALKVDGTQISLGALDACVLPTSTFVSLRLKSSASEGAERVCTVLGQLDM